MWSVVQAAEAQLLKLSNQMRFIMAVISGSIVVSNRKRADIEQDLEAQDFDRIAPASAKVLSFVECF